MNFQINSGLTQGLLIFLSGFLFLGVLLGWKKIYRQGFLNFLVRFFVLVVVLAICISTIGVSINKSQGFYSSWSDLFGSSHDFSSEAIPAINIKKLDSVSLKRAQPISKDLFILREVIRGKDSLVSNVVYLLLPRQLVQSLKARESLNSADYQVTEFLSGFPSQPEIWYKVLKIEEEISTYNSSHARKIIGVVPQVNIAGMTDLECMNLGNGKPDAQTWLTSDMHSFLSLRLGIPDTKWIAVGTSTGAWCAAMFLISQPSLYKGAVSIAGYYRSALPRTDPVALQNAMKKKYNLGMLERKLIKKLPLYIFASVEDDYSIRETRRFLAKLHPHLDINYHEVASGGHNSRVWRPAILPGLEWVISKSN